MFARHVRLALPLVLALGCASSASPPPVAVFGNQGALDALIGDWAGEYSSSESGRSGTISFVLRPGETAAHGDVVMIPRGQANPIRGGDTAGDVSAPARQLLTISFVRTSGGQINGVLDPYRDPECGCLVVTAFVGALTTPSVLEGVFITRHSGSLHTQEGRWRVTKRQQK